MSDGTIVPGNADLANLFKSTFVEKVVETKNGVEFVESLATPTEEGKEWLQQFKRQHKGILIVTSFANLSAYKDESLVGLISTEETARAPMDQKIMRIDKFTQVLS
ncbi:MAG: hypothetical protein ACOX6Q_02630 [Candidatus Dojkabacteria bacterium]